MKNNCCYVIIVVVLCICYCSSVFAGNDGDWMPTTFFVGGSGEGNFSSIQQAVNSAFDGDTIYVYSGVYYENIILNKSLVLQGEDRHTTSIDGGGVGNVVDLQADNCMVSGFTIRDSGMVFPFAGIAVNSDYNIIAGNNFFQNYYGIHLELTAGNTISNNTIFNNAQCGVYFSRASNNKLCFNVVSNHSFNGFGLYEFSNNNILVDNVFTNNLFSGINIRESYGNYVKGNSFISNSVGVHQPTAESKTVVLLNSFSNNGIDLEIEINPFMTIGSAFGLLIVIVFFIIKKRVL